MTNKSPVLSMEQYAKADAEAQAMLKSGIPAKLDDKIALLKSKLDSTLKASPIPGSQPGLSETGDSARQLAAAMSMRPTSVLSMTNPCDMAMMEGVAAITIGSVLGPHAAIVGFGVGVYLLTQSCGEGS